MIRYLHFTCIALVACSSAPTPTAAVSTAKEPTPATAEPDSDGDGVPDACDYCPRQPGINRADHPYGRGCPYIDQFVSSAEFLGPAFRFAHGASTTSARLDTLAAEMTKHTSEHFFVVGHATADEPDPEALSLARATAIADALVRGGVSRSQLDVHAAGATQPASSEVVLDVAYDHARKRAWNEARRTVEYVVLPDLCPGR